MNRSKRNGLFWIVLFILAFSLAALPALDAQPPKDKKPPSGGGLPDDPDVAYVHFGKSVELMLLDSLTGEEGVLLTGGTRPGWSAGGGRIAYFTSGTSADGDIWIMNSDGSGSPVHLIQARMGSGRLDWTRDPAPNGEEMIIFSVIDPDLNWMVYAVNSDGTGLVQLVGPWFNPEWVCVDDPKWSPDGTRFVALDDAYGDYGRLMIFDVDVVDGELAVVSYEQITNLPSSPVTGWAWNIDWSNSGDWITFMMNGEIYILNTSDYMDMRRLTFMPDNEKTCPSFDATDSRIIFVMRDKNKRKLFSIDALDGSGLTLLTDTTNLSQPAARR